MSKRKHEETIANTQAGDLTLYESAPIHDRASIFRAIFTPDANASPKALQRHQPFESAMHKIVGWRKPSAQRSLVSSFGASASSSSQQQKRVVYETGSDEDGEKYAGKKVEKILEEMNVQGVVVVARWYGGVLLGPVRFKWIEDCAREAILMWKKIALGGGDSGSNGVGEGAKKVKADGPDTVQDDKGEMSRLKKLLEERDASVKILRTLLAEKNDELKKLESKEPDEDVGDLETRESQANMVKSPVAATLDYTSMPLQRLKQLEKARDATLQWILKQIDSVEDKIKSFDLRKEKTSDQKDRSISSQKPED